MMEAFVIAPVVLLGMLSAFIPLILLGLVIYFLVQIKRAIEDLSAEVRDTRLAIQDAAVKLAQPHGQSPRP